MKYVIAGIAVISIIFLSQKVTSFSEVSIKSDASVRVTDQANALISVLETEKNTFTAGTPASIELKISNRIANEIFLKGDSVTFNGITFSYEDKTILKGNEQSIQVLVETTSDLNEETYTLPLHFKWENGEATIPAEITILVEKE